MVVELNGKREVVCGVDIHKRFLAATLLTSDGQKIHGRFDTTLEGLQSFRVWLLGNGCQKLAVESTANYWQPLYHLLSDDLEFILANSYQVKHIPGRKTDMLDSDWLAELCLKELIKPSRIFEGEHRELRSLTRIRESYVEMRTKAKNEIHHLLESACIKLSSVVSDIFGRSGMHIIKGILRGDNIETILETIPSKTVRARKEEIRNVIMGTVSPVQSYLLSSLIDTVESLDRKIAQLDSQIESIICRREKDLRIAMSIPGMGFVSASTILAEIGDFRDFQSPEQLASYCGLVPTVYQSSDKTVYGHITKRGSPHGRRMLVEVAHAIARSKTNSRLKRFYLRIKARRGEKIAIVALARKILCILFHLITNGEMYQEEHTVKPKCVRLKPAGSSSPAWNHIANAIQVLTKAGYIVQKRFDTGG